MSQVEIKEQIFKGFFEDIEAKDEYEISVQRIPP
jgi:hypothetical protein